MIVEIERTGMDEGEVMRRLEAAGLRARPAGPDRRPEARPQPGRILQIHNGLWTVAILGTGAEHRIFTHIEEGARTAEAIAERAGLSLRGTQALLDGLVGLGLLHRTPAGTYDNAPDSAAFLVEGKPGCLAPLARLRLTQMHLWSRLPASVRTGQPETEHTLDIADNPLWQEIVPAIAPMAVPVARHVAARLSLAQSGPIHVLDVGGGAGSFAITLLQQNLEARATQLDWPSVNRIAREFAARAGVGDRFQTLDGDFHTTDPGTGHDIILLSNVAHQDSPAENVETFRRLYQALRPGGTLVINEFVLGDDRSGDPLALMFNCEMLLHTRSGASFLEGEYRDWLAQAGFSEITVEPTPTPSRLVLGRKSA